MVWLHTGFGVWHGGYPVILCFLLQLIAVPRYADANDSCSGGRSASGISQLCRRPVCHIHDMLAAYRWPQKLYLLRKYAKIRSRLVKHGTVPSGG